MLARTRVTSVVTADEVESDEDAMSIFAFLRALLAYVKLRRLNAGHKLYILVRGRVEVLRGTDAGDERIAVLDDGDVFGEMAPLFDRPRGATVRALSFCTCLTGTPNNREQRGTARTLSMT